MTTIRLRWPDTFYSPAVERSSSRDRRHAVRSAPPHVADDNRRSRRDVVYSPVVERSSSRDRRDTVCSTTPDTMVEQEVDAKRRAVNEVKMRMQEKGIQYKSRKYVFGVDRRAPLPPHMRTGESPTPCNKQQLIKPDPKGPATKIPGPTAKIPGYAFRDEVAFISSVMNKGYYSYNHAHKRTDFVTIPFETFAWKDLVGVEKRVYLRWCIKNNLPRGTTTKHTLRFNTRPKRTKKVNLKNIKSKISTRRLNTNKPNNGNERNEKQDNNVSAVVQIQTSGESKHIPISRSVKRVPEIDTSNAPTHKSPVVTFSSYPYSTDISKSISADKTSSVTSAAKTSRLNIADKTRRPKSAETTERPNSADKSLANSADKSSRLNSADKSRANSADKSSRLNSAETTSRPNSVDTSSRPNYDETTSKPNSADKSSRSNSTETSSRSNSADTTSRPNSADTTSRPNSTYQTSRPNSTDTTSRSNSAAVSVELPPLGCRKCRTPRSLAAYYVKNNIKRLPDICFKSNDAYVRKQVYEEKVYKAQKFPTNRKYKHIQSKVNFRRQEQPKGQSLPAVKLLSQTTTVPPLPPNSLITSNCRPLPPIKASTSVHKTSVTPTSKKTLPPIPASPSKSKTSNTKPTPPLEASVPLTKMLVIMASKPLPPIKPSTPSLESSVTQAFKSLPPVKLSASSPRMPIASSSKPLPSLATSSSSPKMSITPYGIPLPPIVRKSDGRKVEHSNSDSCITLPKKQSISLSNECHNGAGDHKANATKSTQTGLYIPSPHPPPMPRGVNTFKRTFKSRIPQRVTKQYDTDLARLPSVHDKTVVVQLSFDMKFI